MFSHFFEKFENSKWPPFLKNFSKVGVVYSLDTLGVENFDEIALSPTVKEIEAILCFATFYLALKWPSLASELQTKAKI